MLLLVISRNVCIHRMYLIVFSGHKSLYDDDTCRNEPNRQLVEA